MNDLRKASQALINHWEAGEFQNCTGDMAGHIRVLRQAAAQPEWVRLTDEAKANHEPTGWVKIDEVRQYFDSVGCGTIYKTAGEGRVPLYAAPYTKLDTTAGVLHKEWVGLSVDDVFECWKTGDVVAAVEAKLKEKNT